MNDFIHIYPFFDNKVLFRFYYSFSPLQYWRVYISISYSVWFINRFQSPSILGWSISKRERNIAKVSCFSPLRYWGGLYPKDALDYALSRFQSPSILGWSISESSFLSDIRKVLVPFDIGVVYISTGTYVVLAICFSPLRYWGGLYHSKQTY